jgi:hypothetical protein
MVRNTQRLLPKEELMKAVWGDTGSQGRPDGLNLSSRATG